MQSIDEMTPEEIKTELQLLRESVGKLIKATQLMQTQLLSYVEGYKDKDKQVTELFEVIAAIHEDPEMADYIDCEAIKKSVISHGVLH